jgi:hypothetical protein
MAILLTFLLGIGNFACHGAIRDGRRQLLRSMPGFVRMVGGRAGLVAEFVVLLSALLLVAYSHTAWAWAYFAYTLLNAGAAWLILTQRL